MKLYTSDAIYNLGTLDIAVVDKLRDCYQVPSTFELRERVLEGSIELSWAERNVFTATRDGAILSGQDLEVLADSCHVFIPELLLEDLLRMLLYKGESKVVVRTSETSEPWSFEAVRWNPRYIAFAKSQGLKALSLYQLDPDHITWKDFNASHLAHR